MTQTTLDTPTCEEALDYIRKVIRHHVTSTDIKITIQPDIVICTATGFDPLEIEGKYRITDIKADIYKFGLYWSASVFTPENDRGCIIISLY